VGGKFQLEYKRQDIEMNVYGEWDAMMWGKKYIKSKFAPVVGHEGKKMVLWTTQKAPQGVMIFH